jgi:transposase
VLDIAVYYDIIVLTMYVDESFSKQKGKTYKRVLLRESYRKNGAVKHRTIANISKCSEEEIKAIKLALKHKKNLTKLESGESIKDKVKSKQGLSVGAICLIKALADRLHITRALGNSRMGKLALWQIMARVIDQGSRLSAVRLAGRHAICDLINLTSFNEDDLYENLDWLCKNQAKIEKRIFDMRYKGQEKPKLYLYDVTSSYLEGVENELGDWGYPRDGKKGKLQIVIGLLTDGEGVPVSVEVFKGNTKDTKTFLSQVKKIANRFEIEEVTMVGDRGMIKSAQIKDLKEEHFHYITAITKPQIKKLINDEIFQLGLFSEDVCEVDNDGIRYILRRNPIRVEEIEQTRYEKIDKIKRLIEAKNKYLADHQKAKESVALRDIKKKVTKLKLSKFVEVEAKNRILSIKIDEEKKGEISLLDGCYVIKTDIEKKDASADTVHERYKDLALVEQGFRTIKTGILETRPIFVRKENRTRGHVFVVSLAYRIVHELQKLWADMDLTVQEGIEELIGIDCREIKIGDITVNQIPQPRGLGEKLLKTAKVILPEALPNRNIFVATRRKLPSRRKISLKSA